MLALIAPGQGSQTPGMLQSWITDSVSRNLLIQWSSNIDLDLLQLGTTADIDEVKDTVNAQPLIVATTLLSARLLNIENYAVVSGHSVGEIAAAALSGAISDVDALKLVRVRGIEMAKAAGRTSTSMSAVLGGDRSEVLASIKSLGLVAANENGGGQIVAAGDLLALAALSENPPSGSRVRALAVSGAFHTSYMVPAVAPLAATVANIKTGTTLTPCICNADGAVVREAKEILTRIVNQIANPVRWDLCMESLKAMGVTGVIELAPAGALVGLLKLATPDIETFAIKTSADLDGARIFAERHR